MQGKDPIIAGKDHHDRPTGVTPVRKIPPRFWWTRRIALAWLLLVAAVVGSGLWWRYEADRRVRVELDAIVARGERLDGSRGPVKSLPPEQNAAEHYLRALKKLHEPPRGISIDSYRRAAMSSRAEVASRIDEYLTASAQTLDECRAARGAAGVEWRSASTNIVLIEQSDIAIDPVTLGDLLCLRAIRQAETGDSAASLQVLQDLDALAHALDQDGAGGNNWRVQLLHQSLALAVEEISPHLKPADAQAVRSLITILLDDQPLESSRHMLRVARGDAYIDMDVLNSQKYRWHGSVNVIPEPGGKFLRRGPQWAWTPVAWVIQPMVLCDQARMLHGFDQIIQANRQVTMDRAKRMAEAMSPPNRPSWLWPYTRFLGWTTPMYYRGGWIEVKRTYTTLAVRRLAAGLLALRLFEMEKGGPAQSLTELVPEYLPAVPIDPCDPAGGPIRAKLTEAGPRLYSLGINGLDDGGVLGLRDTPYAPADLVLFLRQEDRLREGWTLILREDWTLLSELHIEQIQPPAAAE